MVEEVKEAATAQAEVVEQVSADPTIVEQIVDKIALYGMNVLAAIIILVVGLWIAKRVKALFSSALQKKEVDPTLVGFFSSMLYGALVIFVAIAAISKVGVQTTSFVA